MMLGDKTTTAADALAEAMTDIEGGDSMCSGPMPDSDESIPYYLAAIAKLLLARELRATVTSVTVQ